jgi:hypothetical protein
MPTSIAEKGCKDMDYNEYKAWAARYLCDGLITGGFREMAICLHVVIQNVLTNEVFGGAAKK